MNCKNKTHVISLGWSLCAPALLSPCFGANPGANAHEANQYDCVLATNAKEKAVPRATFTLLASHCNNNESLRNFIGISSETAEWVSHPHLTFGIFMCQRNQLVKVLLKFVEFAREHTDECMRQFENSDKGMGEIMIDQRKTKKAKKVLHKWIVIGGLCLKRFEAEKEYAEAEKSLGTAAASCMIKKRSKYGYEMSCLQYLIDKKEVLIVEISIDPNDLITNITHEEALAAISIKIDNSVSQDDATHPWSSSFHLKILTDDGKKKRQPPFICISIGSRKVRIKKMYALYGNKGYTLLYIKIIDESAINVKSYDKRLRNSQALKEFGSYARRPGVCGVKTRLEKVVDYMESEDDAGIEQALRVSDDELI
jgi:hypothetical protein